jgi:hypothetical protein
MKIVLIFPVTFSKSIAIYERGTGKEMKTCRMRILVEFSPCSILLINKMQEQEMVG